ncbi:MAG: ABC transporter ATP-binding protein [Clostridia bacterium]|nr:ABC transporter ATP-binding protein [Clostridia bacterium]
MLNVRGLTVRYGSLAVLNDISFTLEAGQWLMVAGPNGAGKSTLVHAISKGVPYRGEVWYRGKNVQAMRSSTLAREMGVLSQSHQVGYAFTVEEVVNLGRYAHRKGRLSFTDEQGEEKVRTALEMTGMLPLRRQSVLTLSGGELQRTFLAQAFAQDPNLILLDEPTNHLDLKYQKQTFELIETWVKQPGRAVISVVHDISLARAYGTHAMLLDQGELVAYGNNREVLSKENLTAVYAMDVQGWMRQMLDQWKE